MESDYSDDDYAPISLCAWGDQSQQESTSQDLTGAKGWSELLGANAKVSEGLKGSGGLHRQGKNYKPIDEEDILKHRLKGGPLPKGDNDKTTRKGRSSGNNKKGKRQPNKPKPTTFSSTTTTKKATTFSHTKPVNKQAQAPPPLSTIRRPPPTTNNSGWGATLVETPFWEKQQEQQQQQHQPSSSSSSSSPSNTDGASASWSNSLVKSDSSSFGFDSNKKSSSPSKPTMMPPPGFKNIPQRRYPLSTGKPSPPPPPGFSYAKQPTSSSSLSSQQWGSKHDNGTRKTTANDLDWVSGWDEITANYNDTAGRLSTLQISSLPQQQQQNNGGWGSSSQLPTPPLQQQSKGGWGSPPQLPTPPLQQQQTNDGWGSNNSKWANCNFMGNNNNNNISTTPPQQQVNNNDGWGSSKSQWSTFNNTTPMQFLDEQTSALKSGRFSDPCKTRYSDQETGPPLPKNYYRKDGVSRPAFMETPTRIAAPPPSHNSVVVRIHLDLENGTKVPVEIRKLDDPTILARTFCQAQNIINPTLINGIAQLFAQQQSNAMQRTK
ncbi:hypothetical protein BC941DRAFT_429049 [Chlamydoabsidia padenii]|nr:hypothetical protein BC941DRAFT_429049 [Chlamydoabsidia padenii]